MGLQVKQAHTLVHLISARKISIDRHVATLVATLYTLYTATVYNLYTSHESACFRRVNTAGCRKTYLD